MRRPPPAAARSRARSSSRRRLRDAMAHAGEHGTRRLCWCDEDFAAWPVGEAEWLAQLTRWARVTGRELVMIARDWPVIERRHPRFVAWRRDWAHVIQCLVPDEARTAACRRSGSTPTTRPCACSTPSTCAAASASTASIASGRARTLMPFRNVPARVFPRDAGTLKRFRMDGYNGGLGTGNARAWPAVFCSDTRREGEYLDYR